MDRLRFKDENNIIFPNPKLTKLSNVLIQGSKDKVEDTSKYKKITVMLNFKGIKFAEIEREMADTRPFYVRRTDEIIIGKQNYFNGSIALVSKEFDGTICSNAIMSFSVKQNSIPYFIYSLLSQNRFMRTREKLANGTGQKELSEKDFLNFDINLPSKQEQEKIGGFLSSFDKFIQKQQEKIDLLKELKKGYLQQMFPSKDSSVPKIRFKKFTEAWEQCELSDIMLDFIVPMRDKPKEFGGQIPWTRIEDIEGKYLNGTKSDQYVSESTVKMMNLKVIPRNSLIVSASATFGVVAIVNTDLITNQTFIGLVPRENYDLDFLYYLFYSSEVVRQMALKSAGSTIFYISRNQFKNMLISAPKLDEQIKVGKILSHLDNLITLHQLKLKSLEDLKQGYMQRLFL